MVAEKDKALADKDRKSFGRTLFRTLVLLCRLLGLVVILIIALLAYLTIFGIPDRIVQDQVDNFNLREQLGVSVGRIRLYPPDGIVVQDMRVEGSRLDLHPLFECEKIWVRFNWREFPGFPDMFSKAHIENGRVGLRIHEEDDESPSLRFVNVSDIDARFSYDGDVYRLESATAQSGQASATSRGTIRYTERPSDAPERPEWALRDWVHTRFLIEYLKLRNQKHNIDRWHREYDDVELLANVYGEINFHIDTFDKEDRTFAINAKTASIACRGVQLDNAVFRGKLDGRDFSASRVYFEHGVDKGQAAFNYNLDTRLLDVQASGNLGGETLNTLLPQIAADKLSEYEVALAGEVSGSVNIGPALVRDMENNFSADISVRDFMFRHLPVSQLIAEVRKDDDIVTARSARIRSDSVEASGGGWYNLDDRSFSGRGVSTFDPKVLVDFIESTEAERIINAIDLHGGYPEYRGLIEGSLADVEQLRISGNLLASDFSYNETPYERFRSQVDFADWIVIFDDFTLSRPEGVASGRVELNLEEKVVVVNAVSGCCPRAIASIVDVKLPERMVHLNFDGATHIAATGRIHWDDYIDSDFEAVVSARDIGFHNYKADQASFLCRLLDNRLSIENIVGSIYGGEFSGKMLIILPREGEENVVSYELEVDAKDMELAQLVKNMRLVMGIESDTDLEVYEGKISMRITLKGYFEDDVHKIDDGLYNVEIRDGRLFRIPLLGGLSQYLSRTIPGFGYLSQTELVSRGMISPNRVYLREVELLGTVLTVKGKGDYYFDHTLDVDVQVVPLRSGYAAFVLRVLTFPVSKLLEFTLTGTLEDPQWNPTNLPKQMFFRFD